MIKNAAYKLGKDTALSHALGSAILGSGLGGLLGGGLSSYQGDDFWSGAGWGSIAGAGVGGIKSILTNKLIKNEILNKLLDIAPAATLAGGYAGSRE